MKRLPVGKKHKGVQPRVAKREIEKRASGFRANRSKEGAERNKWYSHSRWKTLRKQVLEEEPLCRFCGDEASHVDHIQHGENWKEHFYERTNLRALCAPCHNTRSALERVKKQQASTIRYT